MKLYRTITPKEFASLLLGDEILPREQKATVCFRNINGRDVMAADEPFEAVCTFNDKLFWASDYSELKVIMLELDVPESRVLYTGYGIYSTHFFNRHFNPEASWYTMGEFGLARQGLKDYKIPETYISSYNMNDITAVYFMDGCNTSHAVLWREGIEDSFEACRFEDYIYNVLKPLSNQYVKRGLTIEERKDRRLQFNWIESIEYIKGRISLRVFKKKLTEIFPNAKEFISKFQYFNSTDNLESLIAKGNVSYETTLNSISLSYIVDSIYDEKFHYNIKLTKLESTEVYPLLVDKIFCEVLKLVNVDLTYKERYKEVKSLIYTLCLDTNIISR